MRSTLVCLLCLIGATKGRLIFPKGSDVGYIVPDPAQTIDIGNAEDGSTGIELQDQQIVLNRQVREQSSPSASSQYNDLWYPHTVIEKKLNPDGSEVDMEAVRESLKDKEHGIKMGQVTYGCDDAINDLEVDWDYSPANYTCYTPRNALPPADTIFAESALSCNIPPEDYTPQHFCMDEKLEYSDRIPSTGDHRPLWPKFGEYKFVPPQRWLHSIEHGALVMLYHPCTRPSLVSAVRNIVTSCLYKHVITPYTPLTPERPVALVAWGCVLEISAVNVTEIQEFIREKALKGPEGDLRKQGAFSEGLIIPSVVPEGVSDEGLPLCGRE